MNKKFLIGILTLIIAISLCISPIAAGDWTTFQGNVKHTGYASGESDAVAGVWSMNLEKGAISSSPVIYEYSYCIDNYEVSIGFDETGKVVYTNNFDKIIWSVDKQNDVSKLIGKNILDLYKWLGVYCINREYYEYFYNCIFLDFYDKILSELNSNKKFERVR